MSMWGPAQGSSLKDARTVRRGGSARPAAAAIVQSPFFSMAGVQQGGGEGERGS